jgi:amidase
VARLLAVIAGPDGCDPRQSAVRVHDYVGALEQPVSGLRIGIVREGFGRPESLDATDRTVRQALRELSRDGVSTEEISIPWHMDGHHLSAPLVMEGAAEFMFHGNAMGYGLQGRFGSHIGRTWATAWRKSPDDLPDIAKLALLFNLHMRKTDGGSYYRRAQNLRGRLRDAYNQALGRYDLLAMPTTPMTATELPAPGCDFAEGVEAGLNMEGNTAPFDLSGHPAISVPCGLANGLPVGLMLIGRHFDEATVLRVAAAFERIGDWKKM